MTGEVRSVTVRLSMNSAAYAAGARPAIAANREVEAGLGRIQKKGLSTETAVRRIGTAGKVAFAAAALGIFAAEKKAADFNAEMSTTATLAHATQREYRELERAALKTGKSIGFSATDTARAEQELVKAGIGVRDILGGGLKGVLDLAAAGQTDVATATEVAAQAMVAFKLQGKDVPHIADLLAAGADKALGSVPDLGYALAQVATTAHQMGFSIEETVGTLAEFAQAGQIGERGGTLLNQMLLQLASPSKQAAKLMDQYGLSLYDANGQVKSMADLTANLRQSFGDLTPAQRNYALGIIFGSRAVRGANILLADGAAKNRQWTKSVDDAGFAAQQAGGKMDNLKGDAKKLRAELDTALIGQGGHQGFLRNVTQDATELLKKYNQLSDTQKDLFGKAVVGVAATGGALWVASKIYKLAKDTSGVYRSVFKTSATRAVENGALDGFAGRAARGVVPVYVTNKGFGVGDGGAGFSTAAKTAAAAEGGAAASGGLAATPLLFLLGEPIAGIAGAPYLRKNNLPRPTNQGGGPHAGLPLDVGVDLVSGDSAKQLKDVQGLVDDLRKLSGVTSHSNSRGLFGFALTDGDKLANYRDDLTKIDKSFAQMSKDQPQKIFDELNTKARQLGIPFETLLDSLPKTRAALKPFVADVNALPAQVTTDIKTNGVPKTVHDVDLLAAKYRLAPKQITTLLKMTGAPEAQAALDATRIAARRLPRRVVTELRANGYQVTAALIDRLQHKYHLTPPVVRTLMQIMGVQKAAGQVDGLSNLLLGFGRQHPAPRVSVKDQASPTLRYITGLLGGLHDKSVTVTTNYVNRASTNKPRPSTTGGGGQTGGRSAGRIARFANGGLVHRRRDPLFAGEGPKYYKAAYRHGRPYALDGPASWDWPYQTTLSEAQSRAFEQWVFRNKIPFDPSARITDYDMRGYWKRTGGRGHKPGTHFPDTYKTPYDTTFSHESKYATDDNPFYWHGQQLIDQSTGQVIFGKGRQVLAAEGGRVLGPGGPRDDLIPAMLSNREYVINAAAVDHYGAALFDQLNARRFADGGLVGRQVHQVQGGGSMPTSFRITSGRIRMHGDGYATIEDAHAIAADHAADAVASNNNRGRMRELAGSGKYTDG